MKTYNYMIKEEDGLKRFLGLCIERKIKFCVGYTHFKYGFFKVGIKFVNDEEAYEVGRDLCKSADVLIFWKS